jgi:DDE superfamily endonuclease
MCAYPTKDIPNNKEAENSPEEVEQYFPGFLVFIDCTEQQITRPVYKERRKIFYSSGKKKRHTIKNQIMVNNRGYILHKIGYKKGRKHDYDVYKMDRHVAPKEVVNVVDLGYLGIEKDFPEQLSSLHAKRRETN